MATRAEIERELEEIHNLEFEIETRITQGLKPVFDENNVELTQVNIEQRVKEMAAEFARDCKVKNPVLVTVREGAVPFADLFMKELKALKFRFQSASISTSSYHDTSSGALFISEEAEGKEKVSWGARDIFFLEDVIDKGQTYLGLLDLCARRGGRGGDMIALVDKKQPRKRDAVLTGFTISPDAFILGKGLDFNEGGRNLEWIGAVDPALLPTPAEKATLSRKKELNAQLRECIALERQPKNSFFMDCVTSAGLVGVAALGAMSANVSGGVGLMTTVAALTGLTKVGIFARGMSRNIEAVSPTIVPTGPN